MGEEVLTLDAVGDVHRVGPRPPGRRALAGHQRLGHAHPARGTKVLVTAVQGTTLVVWPVDGHPATARHLART